MEHEIIYAAMHNPNIHESAYGVIGLYKTQRGAEIALEFAKHIYEEEEGPIPSYESFKVFEFQLND